MIFVEFAEVFPSGRKVIVVGCPKIVTLPLAIYLLKRAGNVGQFQTQDVMMVEVDGQRRIRVFSEHRLSFQTVDLLGKSDHLKFRFRNEVE